MHASVRSTQDHMHGLTTSCSSRSRHQSAYLCCISATTDGRSKRRSITEVTRAIALHCFSSEAWLRTESTHSPKPYCPRAHRPINDNSAAGALPCNFLIAIVKFPSPPSHTTPLNPSTSITQLQPQHPSISIQSPFQNTHILWAVGQRVSAKLWRPGIMWLQSGECGSPVWMWMWLRCATGV
jgi:hypothetical protein